MTKFKTIQKSKYLEQFRKILRILQGENFSSAVQFCKAHSSPNRNDFVAFGSEKIKPEGIAWFFREIIPPKENKLQAFPEMP